MGPIRTKCVWKESDDVSLRIQITEYFEKIKFQIILKITFKK